MIVSTELQIHPLTVYIRLAYTE